MNLLNSKVSDIISIRGGEITKRLIIVLTFIMISFSLTASHSPPERIQPDTGQRFRIWQSFTMTGGNYTQCDIRVIQCTADNDTDNIFNEIRAFHDNMNGAHEELTIHLYRSKMDLDNCRILEEKTFYKGE